MRRMVANVPEGASPFAGKVTPLLLQSTRPDPDLRKDYEEEARKLIKKEKHGPARTLSLEGEVEPGEVLNVLKKTDEALEKERLERLEKEASKLPDVTGGDGDALVMRKEAMLSAQAQEEPPKKKEEPKPMLKPVPVGGDALTPKPITMEEIEGLMSGTPTQGTPEEGQKAEKQARIPFWRRRRNKK